MHTKTIAMTDQELHQLCQEEASRHDCFLCRPSARLLVDCSGEHYAVAGLGPLTDGYMLVATKAHVERLGRSIESASSFADYVQSIRAVLASEWGGCLLTEHGNMPVCGIESDHSVHCFHPHVLLFPGQHSIRAEAERYFERRGTEFTTLASAFERGAQLQQYLLISETDQNFSLYEPVDGLPRQFARALVAESLGAVERASWRDFPDINSTIKNVGRVRRLLDRAHKRK